MNCMLLNVRSIIYAACLEGSDPVRLFDRRINAKRGDYSILLCAIYTSLFDVVYSMCLVFIRMRITEMLISS